jgi:hypothetical protein
VPFSLFIANNNKERNHYKTMGQELRGFPLSVTSSSSSACGRVWLLLLVVVLTLGGAPTTYASTDDHRYVDGEHVELWVNKVSD